MANLTEIAAQNPSVREVLESGLYHTRAAQFITDLLPAGFSTSERAVRRWRSGHHWSAAGLPDQVLEAQPDYGALQQRYAGLKKQHDGTLRALYDVKHRHSDYLEAVHDSVTECLARQVIAPVRPPSFAKRAGSPEVAVALLSDMQTGKRTPTYNSEICAARVAWYAEKIIKITQVQEKDHPVRTCRVAALGDLVEGCDIFPGQAWLIDSTLYTQLLDTTPVIIVDFIRRLLTYFDSVEIDFVDGNHGRIGRRGQFGPMDNADRMVARVVRLMLRDEPRARVSLTDPEGERNWYRIMHIGNYKALLIHGDQIRGHSGFPWYGLCVPSDHEILTRNGWVTHKELAVGQDVLTYDSMTGENRWEPVQAVNVYPYEGELWTIDRPGGHSIQFTPDHRWPVLAGDTGERLGLLPAREINTNHWLPMHGEFRGQDSVLSPRLAAILGWIVTDGTARWIGNHWEAGIYQSRKKYLAEVEQLLGRPYRHDDEGTCYIPVALADRQEITRIYRDKGDLPQIAGRLSREAAEAMFRAMELAESSATRSFAQRPGPVAEAFQMLSVLLGQTAWMSQDKEGMMRIVPRRKRRLRPAWGGGFGRAVYDGDVWCPTTPSGTWWVRSPSGMVLPTGNSKKVQGWGSGGLGEDSDFGDMFMGHYHQLGAIPLNHRMVWANGSTESSNTFAQENLAAQSEPSQWLLFVDPDGGHVTASYGVRLK